MHHMRLGIAMALCTAWTATAQESKPLPPANSEVESIVRQYILDHGDVLIEAVNMTR